MLKKYAAETNDKVKDRIMLIIKIKHDSTDICEVARSLGKSDSWEYKWHARYRQAADGLDDQPRTGRPPKVNMAVMKEI